MKTFKIFLRLKKEEIIEKLTPSMSFKEMLGMVMASMVIFIGMCTIGTIMGTYLWWCELGALKYKPWEIELVGVGAVATFFFVCIGMVVYQFLSWIRDNWRMAVKEASIG